MPLSLCICKTVAFMKTSEQYALPISLATRRSSSFKMKTHPNYLLVTVESSYARLEKEEIHLRSSISRCHCRCFYVRFQICHLRYILFRCLIIRYSSLQLVCSDNYSRSFSFPSISLSILNVFQQHFSKFRFKFDLQKYD